MNKYLHLLLIVVLVALGFIYFALDNKRGLPVSKPWIEIISPAVFAGDKELKNSDQLEMGWEVKTGVLGKANIHFADGSVARLEPNTSLIIKDSFFDSAKKISVISLFLNFGEVISQVTELATPESVWEVKTANAVAVVRGTKYSVKYDKENSIIKVFEDSVLVAVIDPKTGLVIEGTELLLEAGYFTEINQKNIDSRTRPGVFEAVLIFSDGASQTVTKEVEWQLSDEERGVSAIWRDPVTGRELRGRLKNDGN